MKLFLFIILTLFTCWAVSAQQRIYELSSQRKVSSQENAKELIKRFYEGLSECDTDPDFRKAFIKNNVQQNAKLKPDYYSEKEILQYLSCEQYIQGFLGEYKRRMEKAKPVFKQSAYTFSDFYLTSDGLSSYVIVDFDNVMTIAGNVVFSNRVSFYCIFPTYNFYWNVLVWQIESKKKEIVTVSATNDVTVSTPSESIIQFANINQKHQKDIQEDNQLIGYNECRLYAERKNLLDLLRQAGNNFQINKDLKLYPISFSFSEETFGVELQQDSCNAFYIGKLTKDYSLTDKYYLTGEGTLYFLTTSEEKVKSASGTFINGFLQKDKPFLIEYADGTIVKPHPNPPPVRGYMGAGSRCYICVLNDNELILRLNWDGRIGPSANNLKIRFRSYFGTICFNNMEIYGTIENFKPKDGGVIVTDEIGISRNGLFKNGVFDGYVTCTNVGRLENIAIEYYRNGKQVPINGHRFTVQAKCGKALVTIMELYENKTEVPLLYLTSIFDREEYTTYTIENIPHSYYIRIHNNGIMPNLRGKLAGYGKSKWYKIDKDIDGGKIIAK